MASIPISKLLAFVPVERTRFMPLRVEELHVSSIRNSESLSELGNSTSEDLNLV